MPTAIDYQRLRDDIGADATTLSDSEAEALLAEAGETYADERSKAAYARVLAIRRLLASHAKITTYRQNASSENASDIFKHLKDLLGYWQGELDEAKRATSVSGGARFGRTVRYPRRIKEHPNA